MRGRERSTNKKDMVLRASLEPTSSSGAIDGALDRTPASTPDPGVRVQALDVASAIAAAEHAACAPPRGDHASTTGARLLGCIDATLAGERASLVVSATELASAREAMHRAASRRVGTVVHALAGHGGEELTAFLDVGWGVLVSSGPEHAHALALVARRAAEASGIPVIVVHPLADARSHAGLVTAMSEVLLEEQARAYVGAPRPGPSTTPESDERALGVALRASFDALSHATGRRHAVLERAPSSSPDVVLVGAGAVGDALLAVVPSLRARGLDVGAVQISCVRPFPGERLVKVLARARAVIVVEPRASRLGAGPIACELKAGFCDALTWSPGYPGIGRVPTIHGVDAAVPFSEQTLHEWVGSVLADERDSHREQGDARADALACANVSKLRLDDADIARETTHVVLGVLASTLGVRATAIERREQDRATVDVVSARGPAVGALLARTPDLVVVRGASESRPGPPRTVGIAASAGVWSVAGACAGAVVAAARASSVGGPSLEAVCRAVAHQVRARGGDVDEAVASARDALVRGRASRVPREPTAPMRW